MKPKDLVPYLGSPSRVSEVLSGRRRLSLAMIRNLIELGIPAEVLLQETKATPKRRVPRSTLRPRPLATA